MGRLNNKRVLVTGASGFIGSHLTRAAIQEGADVTVLCRYASIEHNVRLSSIWGELKTYEADICHLESLLGLKNKAFDIVFHLAAYNHVGNSFYRVNEALSVNCNGTANVLEALQEYNRLVYVSSSEVYGYQPAPPFVEHKEPNPSSPYAVGKYAGELYSRMKFRTGKPIAVLRPFNAFGPYQSTRAVIPELIDKCLRGVPVLTTEGRQTREFNFVDDLVEGMLLASLSENSVGQIINLGTGHDISIRDVAQLIHEKTRSRSELSLGALKTRPNEIWTMRADASKARELLHWRPKVSFEEGIENTIEWFQRYLRVYYSEDSALRGLNAGDCAGVTGAKRCT